MYKSLPKTRHQTHAAGAGAVAFGAVGALSAYGADKGAKFEPFYTAGPIGTDRSRLVPSRRFDQKR